MNLDNIRNRDFLQPFEMYSSEREVCFCFCFLVGADLNTTNCGLWLEVFCIARNKKILVWLWKKDICALLQKSEGEGVEIVLTGNRVNYHNQYVKRNW